MLERSEAWQKQRLLPANESSPAKSEIQHRCRDTTSSVAFERGDSGAGWVAASCKSLIALRAIQAAARRGEATSSEGEVPSRNRPEPSATLTCLCRHTQR